MSDTIRAKEFIVVGDDGRERAKLGSCGDGVTLNLCGAGNSNITVAVDEAGNPRFEIRSGEKVIRLSIDGRRAQVKLTDHANPVASCGLTIDDAGAWVYAEATPDIGVRMLCNRGGEGTSVWLAEKRKDLGELMIRTRYIRPEVKEDSTGGWQCRP